MKPTKQFTDVKYPLESSQKDFIQTIIAFLSFPTISTLITILYVHADIEVKANRRSD
jgi:hypothetical protein